MKSGYGKYRCGNCKWFDTPRLWGKGEPERNCQDKFSVEAGHAPCAAKSRGYGEFDPINMGERADTIKKLIGSMSSDDLVMIRILADRREEQILRDGISNYRIGDNVVFSLAGDDVPGEVIGLTRKYVVVQDPSGKQRKLLPGSLRFV